MTDKQIIKPCPICLYEDTCLHLKQKTRLCEDCIHHKNYWSELLEKEQVEKIKSLEQECEELKKENCELTEEVSIDRDLFAEIDQLKAENEKYSLFIEKLCDYTGLECDDEEQAMRTLSDFARQMNKARWIIDRYKQTLTEIKEIAKNSCCLQPTSTCEEYENCKECSRTSDDETIKQILQKISECEAENEI